VAVLRKKYSLEHGQFYGQDFGEELVTPLQNEIHDLGNIFIHDRVRRQAAFIISWVNILALQRTIERGLE
jgi:hypothetical protein